jgi:hypothetical protein
MLQSVQAEEAPAPSRPLNCESVLLVDLDNHAGWLNVSTQSTPPVRPRDHACSCLPHLRCGQLWCIIA